jgi:hypothetical protein
MKTKRYDGEEDSEVTEDVSSAEDYGNEDKRTSDAAVVAPSGKKPKIVTKEELGGMSLRDYLNKQQGLTRRKDTASEKRPTRPGQESDTYSNEGRNKLRGMEENQGHSVFPGGSRAPTSRQIATRMGVNPNTLLPNRMAAGGSASSRADGIAQRGKTKGKMC